MIDILAAVKKPLLVLISLALGLTGCARTLTAGPALVNGVSITQADLDAAASGAAQTPGEVPTVDVQRQALVELIQQELLRQVAQKRKIVVAESDVTEQIEAIKQQSGDPATFAARLAQAGLTEKTLADRVRLNLLLTRLGESVSERVSAAELREVYDASKSQFTQVKARVIVFGVDQGSDPEAVRKEAAATLARIRAGASFAAEARKRSDDPGTAVNGGSLGDWHSIADDEAPIADAFATSKLGRAVGPIVGQGAYHLVQVSARRVQPFAEVKDRLRQDIEGRTGQLALQGLLTDATKVAQVLVNPKYGDWDAESSTIVPHQPFTPADTGATPSPEPSFDLGSLLGQG